MSGSHIIQLGLKGDSNIYQINLGIKNSTSVLGKLKNAFLLNFVANFLLFQLLKLFFAFFH